MCVALMDYEMVNMHVVMCQKKRSHKKVCKRYIILEVYITHLISSHYSSQIHPVRRWPHLLTPTSSPLTSHLSSPHHIMTLTPIISRSHHYIHTQHATRNTHAVRSKQHAARSTQHNCTIIKSLMYVSGGLYITTTDEGGWVFMLWLMNGIGTLSQISRKGI